MSRNTDRILTRQCLDRTAGGNLPEEWKLDLARASPRVDFLGNLNAALLIPSPGDEALLGQQLQMLVDRPIG